MSGISAASCAVALVALLVTVSAQVLSTAPSLPPVSWSCPMHPDVIEDKPGACPICKMTLEPVRLDTAWSCPVHTAIAETQPGKCPICQRNLVQVTVALTWTCPVHSDVREGEPGRCKICGRELAAIRERRPHGDHNPRHGGIFFMAADNWHHLEGAYPKAGVFRLFVYDDYTRPLAVSAFTARAVTKETRDHTRKEATEIQAYPLQPSKDAAYLKARLPVNRLPAEITAKIRFTAKGDEYRFDFVFPTYSKDQAAPAPTPTATSPAILGSSGVAVDPLPGTTSGLLAALKARSQEVGILIQQGAYAQVYVPALSTKDAALALETRVGDVPDNRRPAVTSAVKRVVVAAWLLDLYGDLGDRERLNDAYRSFAAAVADLTQGYATSR